MGGFEHMQDERVVDVEARIDISKEFDGNTHWSWGRWLHYRNPGPNAAVGPVSGLYRHRDALHRVTWRAKETDRYLSPTDRKPRHLVVQASQDVLQDKTGTWRRTEITGNAPWLLRLSSWALKELQDTSKGSLTGAEIAIVAGKVFVCIPLQMLLLSFPMGREAKWSGLFYKTLPTRSWEYPVYAQNYLDARPDTYNQFGNSDQRLSAAKEQTRLLRPRRLVVSTKDGWRVESNTADIAYIFISYTRRHWNPDDIDQCQPLHQLAQHLAETAGVQAYWLDHQCISPDTDMTEDIHAICDVVRGAEEVVVAVPSVDLDTMAVWGSRMWTLPEVLICQNNIIRFCDPKMQVLEKTRISLAQAVWGNDQAGRLLAEHFSGTLTLSRLELIQVALRAMSSRETKPLYSNGDMAYALMGLLNRRPQANMRDNQFQALARLSLANDSDRIIERMICMLPPAQAVDTHATEEKAVVQASTSEANRKFVLDDELNANLWDIDPLCQVAGVCAGSGLLLDGCRGASIRWKDIPPIAYVKRASLARTCLTVGLRSGLFWFILGCVLFSAPSKAPAVIFLLIGLALIISSPWTIVRLYGGKVWGAAHWLVGIEGVLPIDRIETLAFGNSIGRLRWAPTSSLLAWKNKDELLGAEPSWITGQGPKPQLPPGHRLFTLVDTGTMTVHLFAAERPPTAAVIAGREGGMLRVLLCSYDRSTDTLTKETVLRMETPMMDKAGLLGWIKLA